MANGIVTKSKDDFIKRDSFCIRRSVTLSNDGDDHATVTITATNTESDVPALDSDLLQALKEVIARQTISGKKTKKKAFSPIDESFCPIKDLN